MQKKIDKTLEINVFLDSLSIKEIRKLHNFNINLFHVSVNKPSKCTISLHFYANGACKLYIELHTDRNIWKKKKKYGETILYFKKESRNNINFKTFLRREKRGKHTWNSRV